MYVKLWMTETFRHFYLPRPRMNYLVFIPATLNVLMVVGGFPSPAYKQVELVDFSGQNRTCIQPPDFLGADFGSVGTYIDDYVIVCGGADFTGTTPPYDDTCWTYSNNSWSEANSMLDQRYAAAAITLDESHWWVTGTYNQDIMSTEVYDATTQEFSYSTDLPEKMGFHTLVRINSTHIVVVGNDYKAGPSDRTYIYNQETLTFTDGPTQLEARSDCTAGLVTYANQTKAVVVAGGVDSYTSEIWNLDGFSFQPGPIMDNTFEDANSVPFMKSFLIVGDSGGSQEIHTFDPEIGEFVLLPQRLAIPRSVSASFMVPEEYCSA